MSDDSYAVVPLSKDCFSFNFKTSNYAFDFYRYVQSLRNKEGKFGCLKLKLELSRSVHNSNSGKHGCSLFRNYVDFNKRRKIDGGNLGKERGEGTKNKSVERETWKRKDSVDFLRVGLRGNYNVVENVEYMFEN